MASPNPNPQAPKSWPCPLGGGAGSICDILCHMCQGSGEDPLIKPN
jgi:hypothetical protein